MSKPVLVYNDMWAGVRFIRQRVRQGGDRGGRTIIRTVFFPILDNQGRGYQLIRDWVAPKPIRIVQCNSDVELGHSREAVYRTRRVTNALRS